MHYAIYYILWESKFRQNIKNIFRMTSKQEFLGLVHLRYSYYELVISYTLKAIHIIQIINTSLHMVPYPYKLYNLQEDPYKTQII